MDDPLKIVIFASGNGTNAERIISYFQQMGKAKVSLVLCNNPKANVLNRVSRHQIAAFSFNRSAFYKNDFVLDLLRLHQPDLIVLAGFLWLFPQMILNAFPNQVINIHPALLPDFGGKGMYGDHVHKAVIAAAKEKSGITIHYVTQNYDEGAIIFQAETKVEKDDTPETLAAKIHELEYEHFPRVIEKILLGKNVE
ncbi:MAG: phosphoribosylglycinamide formyltransferase [Leeuwenhoekiella sp.]